MNQLAPLQQQVNNFWQRQSKPQRITFVALLLAAVIIIPVIIVWSTKPTYAVAYSGLSESDAGQIVQKLDDNKIPYQLKDTGTILVPSNQVYEVRLMMAREGMPENGTVGFELFSGNTLGMTEFTEKVNYRRALEGELERTIGSLASVQAVRVHIVIPEKTLLADEQEPTTASVTVEVKPGQQIDQGQVKAITHLVASSVEGLKPESVVVVDTNGNMLADGTQNNTDGTDLAQSDSQRAAEQTASRELQKKVQTMLDSVLGPNKSVVQASVVLDWTQKEINSQTFDPTPVAVRSSQKTNETYTTNGGATSGIPGAASNLPTPVATLSAGSGASSYQRSDETLNYEISQVQSHEIVSPGQVKRISLSVMVDGITDEAQINTLKSAVAAAAGIDQNRGDSLAVESLAFDRTYFNQQQTDLQEGQQTDLYIKIAEIAGAVLVLGALLIFFSRMFRNIRMASGEGWTPVMQPVGEAIALPTAPVGVMPPQVPAMSTNDQLMAAMAAANEAKAQDKNHQDFTPKVSAPTAEEEQMTRALGQITEENPATVAEIIQLWLSEDEKHHG